jgi:hypothetical protein
MVGRVAQLGTNAEKAKDFLLEQSENHVDSAHTTEQKLENHAPRAWVNICHTQTRKIHGQSQFYALMPNVTITVNILPTHFVARSCVATKITTIAELPRVGSVPPCLLEAASGNYPSACPTVCNRKRTEGRSINSNRFFASVGRIRARKSPPPSRKRGCWYRVLLVRIDCTNERPRPLEVGAERLRTLLRKHL